MKTSDIVSPGAFDTIYHNTMGVFWLSIGEHNTNGIVGAVKQVESYRKAVTHFFERHGTLKQGKPEDGRRKIELEATLYLNMAYASRRLGENDRAGQNFESALDGYSKRTFFLILSGGDLPV